jgi:hypothetical protein
MLPSFSFLTICGMFTAAHFIFLTCVRVSLSISNVLGGLSPLLVVCAGVSPLVSVCAGVSPLFQYVQAFLHYFSMSRRLFFHYALTYLLTYLLTYAYNYNEFSYWLFIIGFSSVTLLNDAT